MAESVSKTKMLDASAKAEQAAVTINPKLVEKVTVTLEAFLGDATMSVGEIAALQQGAVIHLDAPLSQAAELRLNGIAVARGELVAVGDKFAVRLVEISK